MSENYVTLGQYWEASEPLMLKSVLEAYGIDAVIMGEYAGNITPFLGVFGGKPHGGVELRVASEDAERAREILAGSEALEEEQG